LIAVDTNLLVYAHRRDSSWFEPARQVLRALIEGSATWAIPWPCLHEFLAISTHPHIYRPPTELPRALGQVAASSSIGGKAIAYRLLGHLPPAILYTRRELAQ
jgi:uncharacterized protein